MGNPRVKVILEGVDRSGVTFEKFERQLSKLERHGAKMDKLGRGLQASGFFMDQYAQKAQRAFAGMLGPARQFESGMAEISTLLPDLPADEFDKLKDSAQALFRTDPSEMTQKTRALYDTISAGITDPVKALRFLEVASKAAVAGVSDISTAVDLGTTVLNNYAKANLNPIEAFNKLQATVRQGKTDFNKLAASLGNVLPVAANFNFSIDETLAAMATLTAATGQTAESATALRSLMSSLAAGPETAKGLREIGGEALLTQARGGDLLGVMDKLARLNLKPDQIRKIFPDIEAVKAVAVLTGAVDKLRSNVDGTAKSAEELDHAYEKMTKTFDYQASIVESGLNDALIELGSVAMPMIKDGFEVILPLVEGFTDLVKEHPTLTKFSVAALGIGTGVLTAGAAVTGLVGSVLVLEAGLTRGAAKAGLFGLRVARAGRESAAARKQMNLLGGATDKAGKSFLSLSGRNLLGDFIILKEGAEAWMKVIELVQGKDFKQAVGWARNDFQAWLLGTSSGKLEQQQQQFSNLVESETARLASESGPAKSGSDVVFKDWESDWIAGGEKLTKTLAGGIDKGNPALERSMKDLAAAAADHLPHSDAKRGPLSDLTHMGSMLPRTFAAGMRGSASELPRALTDIINPAAALLSGASGAGAAFSPGAAPANKAGSVVHVTIAPGAIRIDGSGKNTRELAALVRQQLENIIDDVSRSR